MSSRALPRSAVAASRFSLLSSIVRGMRKPVKSGTVVPSERDVLLVFLLEYVFSDVRPRPNDQFCDAEAFRSGRRLFFAVLSCTSFCRRVTSCCFTVMLFSSA